MTYLQIYDVNKYIALIPSGQDYNRFMVYYLFLLLGQINTLVQS